MSFYLSYFKLRFITSLQYKAQAIAGILTQIFFGFVFIMVYLAFYESNNNVDVMSLSELITYLWLGQAFFSLTYIYYRDNEIFNIIKNGNIAYELIRPRKLYFIWYFKILGVRLAGVLLRFLPVLVLAFLLPYPYKLSLPYNFISFILFIVTLFIGTLLVTSFICFYHILSLKLLNDKGIVVILCGIADIFSGGVVPIPFFPKYLKFIANILPFRYIFDLSYRVYSNNIGTNEALFGIVVQLLWFLIITLLGYILLNKILKKVIVQGG